MSDSKQPKILEMRGITKYFPGICALNNVDMELYKGEILAVVGENGAGKSTLMGVLGGILHPDKGKIFIDEKETAINTVETATKSGISFVHQELNLSDNLDIAANVYLGREPRKKNFLKLIDKKKLYANTEVILKTIDLNHSPKLIVKNLSIGVQQMVEIAKALSINAKIIIMDEPTSSLSQHETVQLMKVIKDLKSNGVSVIYISHRLGEVKELADRVLVLRDGQVSGSLGKEEINNDRMINLMVGRDVSKFYHLEHEIFQDSIFEVSNFMVPGKNSVPINFKINKGEIVVFAGLVGAGRTELAHAIFGIDKPLGGEIIVDGKKVVITDTMSAIKAGIGLIPEDRKLHGLVVEMPIETNISLTILENNQIFKMIKHKKIRQIADKMAKLLKIRLTSIFQSAQSLSGGNQQKVVLAKWLATNPKILIMDEPTRGIDVVAKEEIYRLMEQLVSEGMGIMVISSEMNEVIGIADRILVMHEGNINGELKKGEFSEEAIVKLATGGK
jgi:ribose transport system ATP-binding protein